MEGRHVRLSVRNPIQKDGLYYGNIKEKQANLILATREQECVDNLSQMLFEFPAELVLRSLDEGRSIRDIISEENIDYEQHIGKLKNYQTVATAFMYMSPRSIIGDGVGLGKTAEVAALINYLKNINQLKRFLIGVETSALGQTQCEMIKFTGLHVVQLPSEQSKMRKVIQQTNWADVDGVIVKHSALRSDLLSRWLSLYLDEKSRSRIFDLFILDESSVVKNKNNKIYDYTNNICNIIPRVHFLNATTFETSIMDIYNQIDMMDSSILPRKWRIEKEFCRFGSKKYWKTENGKPTIKYNWKLNGYKNQEIFKNSLKLFYFGRAKKDVMEEVQHQYKVYEVQPTNEQSLALAKGYRYMEVLNCPSLIKELNIPCNRKNVPKINRLVQLMEDELHDYKTMIYCFHLEAQKAIAEELNNIGKKTVILNGSNTDEERWAIVNDFNKGVYDVLITNIKKSLNLFGGEACIIYTVETNPAKMEQIRGRIDRNTDDKTRLFILLVYGGTDEHRFLTEVISQRAKDARSLTIDSKTAIDYFMEAMN